MEQGKGLPCKSFLVPAPFFSSPATFRKAESEFTLLQNGCNQGGSRVLYRRHLWALRKEVWEIVDKHMYILLSLQACGGWVGERGARAMLKPLPAIF